MQTYRQQILPAKALPRILLLHFTSLLWKPNSNHADSFWMHFRASLEYLKVMQCCPDILHIHEWQTAAVAMLFWEHYNSCGLERARLVFTIHNLDSQGECRQEEFAATGKHDLLQSWLSQKSFLDARADSWQDNYQLSLL